MRITNRIMISILSLSLLLIFSGLVIVGCFFVDHAHKHEFEQLEERLLATEVYLQAMSRQYSTMTQGYAQTYQTLHHRYATGDVQAQSFLDWISFENHNLHLKLLINQAGHISAVRFLDEDKLQHDKLPDGLGLKLLPYLNSFSPRDNGAFYITAGSDVYLISFSPVFNNLSSGKLVIGRRLDTDMNQEIFQIARSNLNIKPAIEDNFSLYQSFNDIYIRKNSLFDKTATAFMQVQTNPVLYMSLDMTRTEFNRNIRNYFLLIIVFSLLSIILILIVIRTFNRRLIRPIENLTYKINEIRIGRIEKLSVETKSKNEVTVLAQAFNSLVDTIKYERQQLYESESYLRTTFENAPIGIAIGDENSNILDINHAFAKIVDRPIDSLKSMSFKEITHPDDLLIRHDLFRKLIDGKIDHFTVEKRYIRPDGEAVWTQMTAAPMRLDKGDEKRFLYMVEDISTKRTSLAALEESERSKDVLLRNLPGMAYRCRFDQNYTMLFVSQGCHLLTGYPPDNLLHNRKLSYSDLIDEKYRQDIWAHWQDCVSRHQSFTGEYPISTAKGIKKWVYEQGMPIYNEKGQVEALEGLIIDVTDRKENEMKIEYLNQRDVLTGLFNRRYYEKMLDAYDQETYLPLTIMIGDINGLKLVNDAFGHNEGDQLIKKTAQVLAEKCRSKDVLARTGGDEFTLLMPNTDGNTAYKVMREIQLAARQYNEEETSELFHISISLGYDTKINMSQKIMTILDKADDYMRKHKLLEQRSSQSSVIASILTTLNERSQETEAHAERLATLAKRLGMHLDLSQFDLDKLVLVARLHDIGKINIDNKILNKPGQLDEEEWVEMKKHPQIGYRIAVASPELVSIADLILTHHERWDGKGYPQGLTGTEIPILSRIITIVDAYDAMIQDRPYRRALSREEALNEIERCAGSQFDPELARLYVKMMKEELDSSDSILC